MTRYLKYILVDRWLGKGKSQLYGERSVGVLYTKGQKATIREERVMSERTTHPPVYEHPATSHTHQAVVTAAQSQHVPSTITTCPRSCGDRG